MEAVIYTKICLHCVYGEMFQNTMNRMHKKGMYENVLRTQYLPKLHEEATKLYGNENYVAFVYFPDTGKVVDFYEYMIQLENEENSTEEKTVKTNVVKKKPTSKTKCKSASSK